MATVRAFLVFPVGCRRRMGGGRRMLYVGTACFLIFVILQLYIHQHTPKIIKTPAWPDLSNIAKFMGMKAAGSTVDPYSQRTLSDIGHYDDGSDESYLYNISIQSNGRLGNQMFSYASMLGVAHMLHMKPHLPEDHYLLYFFELSVAKLSQNADTELWEPFQEDRACAYDHRVNFIQPVTNIKLLGFFQSWKYFRKIERRIRKEFTFIKTVKEAALEFIKDSIHDSYGTNATRQDVVLVGVHIRRYDMLDMQNQIQGYTVAGRAYIESAMIYFEAKYTKILFIVCTDDLEWAQDNVSNMRQRVVFSEGRHAMVDLAILSLCDHSIITVGSFGWWAAWLAGGTTVYYKDFPQKYSMLALQFEAEDYVFPGWIGLSNR